jgi:mannan polymerase II complex MNN11 subunit
MHFAFPPRKPSAHTTMYPARSKAPLFRRSRIQFLVLCALGIGTLIFIIAKILGIVGGAPAGTPPVVIITVLNPGTQNKEYLDDIRANREEYAKKHGNTVKCE